jgi:hypothetical protein
MVNPLFWSWSLVAEVFPLNNLLASIMIYLLVSWQEQPERSGLLIRAAFVAGLALANHQTIVLLGPAVCFLLWRRRAILWKRLYLFPVCIAAFVLGLLPYLYIPWAAARHPPYSWGGVSSFADLVNFVTRKIYGSGQLVSATGYTGGPAIPRLVALGASFRPLAAALIMLGIVQVYRTRRCYFWFTLIAFFCAGPLFVWMTGLNLATAPSALFVLQRFFLLSHVVLAPLIALGVVFLTETFASSAATLRPAYLNLIAIAAALGILAVGLTNYSRIDQSHNLIARHFGEDVFASAGPDSIFLATGDAVLGPLLYLQAVENMRKDVTVVALPLLGGDWYLRQLRQNHSDLVVPFEHYDAQKNNLRKLVEANPNREICFASTLGNEDHSLDHDYWPYQYGLLDRLEPKSKSVDLRGMASDTERLFASYHPPSAQAVRSQTFEGDILMLYTVPAFTIASNFERAGDKMSAREWYERALKINPGFKPARDAIAGLSH